MMAGEILQIGSPKAIYLDPADIRVAAFVGSPSINMFAATAETDGRVRIGADRIDMTAGMAGALTLGVRPEDLVMTPRGGLETRLEHVEFLGESVLVHVRHMSSGTGLIARFDGRTRPDLAVGAHVRLGFDPARAFLFGSDGKRVAARHACKGIVELVSV